MQEPRVRIEAMRIDLKKRQGELPQEIGADAVGLRGRSSQGPREVPAQHEDREAVGGDDHRDGADVVEFPDRACCDAGVDDVLALVHHSVEEGISGVGFIAQAAPDVGDFLRVLIGVVQVVLDKPAGGTRVRFFPALGGRLGQDVLVACLTKACFAAEMMDDQARTDAGEGGHCPDCGTGESVAAEETDGGVPDACPGG